MNKIATSAIDACKNKNVYLWGAGSILNRSTSFIEGICHIKGIFDKNAERFPDGINGYPVFYPDKINELVKEDVIILITCIYVGEIEILLKKAGIKHIYNIFSMLKDPIFRFHGEPKGFDEEILKLNYLLADQKSKDILGKIIQYRKNEQCNYSAICEGYQYFPKGIWRTGEHEVFVDIGAYTGDTITAIKEETQNRFTCIHAFEPDQKNFKALKDIAKDDDRIKCYPYAAWDKSQRLQFSLGEEASSFIDEDGMDFVEAKALDDILLNEKITFIKMDVEGAELKALRGARKIIEKYKPKLAICVYHEPCDLWEIPFYLQSIVPEYKFYLRHHHPAWFETILYAMVDEA